MSRAYCRAAVLGLTVAALGCANGAQSRPAGDALGPLQAPGHIDPDVAMRAVDFRGSCAWGRAPGSGVRYRVTVHIAGAPSEAVPVRSDSRFDPFREDNIIGRVTSGTALLAEGPLYDATTGRTGYAVLVRGVSGRVCRGYVSAASVAFRPTWTGQERTQDQQRDPALVQ